MARPEVVGVEPLADVQWEDPEEAALVSAMEQDARAYLLDHAWCISIRQMLVGFAVGKVIAVFLAEIESPPSVDDWLWVVVGDLPSAYFVTDQTTTSCDAIEVYCELMEAWVTAVRTGAPLSGVFPVAAAATAEHADMLASRIESLRNDIVPACRADPALVGEA